MPLFGTLLPRHLEIIYEINRRFLDDVRRRHPGRRRPGADGSRSSTKTGERVRPHGAPRLRRQPRHQRRRGAAQRAAEGDGASRLPHGRAARSSCNVTNGVTPRRWIALSNPGLSALITRTIGDGWIVGSRVAAGAARAAGDRRRLPGGVAGGQGRQQERGWPP